MIKIIYTVYTCTMSYWRAENVCDISGFHFFCQVQRRGFSAVQRNFIRRACDTVGQRTICYIAKLMEFDFPRGYLGTRKYCVKFIGVSRCRASNVNLLCLPSVIVEGERYFAWQLTSVPRIHCTKDRRRGWFVLHWECGRGEMMVQRCTLKEFSCVYLLFHSAN